MDNLEKILSTLPKNKISKRTDLKIKFRLYQIIFLKKLDAFFNLSFLNNYKRSWALALIVFLIFGTTSVYAYASSNVSPGNVLYPLKIVIEKIEQKTAITPVAKIANYEKLSARRLQEAVNLSQKNPNSKQNENIKKNIESEINNHAAIVSHINNLDNKNIEAATVKASKKDQKEIDYLDKIGEYAKNNKNEDILQKVNEAKEIIKREKIIKEVTSTPEIKSKEDNNKDEQKNNEEPKRQEDRKDNGQNNSN